MEYPAITAVANETSIENKIMEDPLACNESPGDLSNINTASCKSEKDEIDSVSSNSKEQFNDAQKMLDIDLGQFGEIKDGKKPYINSSLPENVGLTENSITNYEESTLNDINAIDANSIEAVAGVKRKYEIDDEFPSEAKKRSNTLTDEKKIANLRKNIRDVMGENQLDTNTLVAQREESERLARVAEQQKLIREYQRQTAVNKQNVRTQNRVISLLQSGNTFAKVTDILDDSPVENSTSTCSSAIYGSCSEGNNNQSANIDSPLSKDKDSSFTNTSTISNNDVLTTPELPINDVVTIEDSSSEDDCILLSDDEEEDIEEETEDDPNNSGLHVKDAYNVPDEQGRVVVNIGHPEGEEDIFVAPQIAKTIKPHQIGGVRFLFDNIIESTKRFNSSTGFGCILAHSMGLGKTLQVVCFCDIFLRHTDSKTVLCVMPINTLQNWVSEFNMWTPKESYNPEEVRPRTFNVFVLNDQQKTLSARAKVILKWAEEGGVLLMGYELFRLLALKLIPNRKRRVGKHVATEKIETEANKRLSESIYKALVKPGPDLVICDEGHRIKNSHAGISLALKQIRTRRRIVLTGYPLQNNLLEYWCMVDFVRPNYLGTRTEFSNMFERPIQNGQCIDSTPEDIKLMRYRAHVLHSLLVGFVQRRSHVVLQQSLPQKLEYVILTKMTSFQRKLYDTFMNDVVRKKTVPNPLKAFAVCCKIWNHPDVLYNFLKKRETDLDLEIDDAEGSPDISTSLKDNLDKNEKSLSVSNFNDKTKLCNTEPQITATNIGSKTVIKDLKPPDASFHDPLSMPKDQLPVSKSEYRNMENVNLNKSYGNEYYTQTYYQCNNTGTYAPEGNGNNYWHDSNTPYYGYQPLCNDIGSPLRPDYVGMVVKKTSEMEISNSSSQIVDLDTKEIKTVETDIDVAINQIMNNTDEKKTSTTRKGIFKQSDSLNESSSSTISHPSSMSSLSSPNNNGSQNFEKESLKVKGEDGIPYDWAIDIMKGYEPNLVQNSPKMEIFFCILNESIKQGDRVLVFSQSLLTLNLIEKFLQSTPIPHSGKCWARNASYFRLDGSTTSQEREKLVNDFNSNADFILFLISTKAGSLGINLVGANRVIVFDASWNPCHDTQAVYRIYRYGQQKPCFVYRIVMDKCLEKKIYDRQVKKQGMSDRVVDECNPDAHLSMKDVTNLCYDFDTETDANQSSTEFSKPIDSYSDIITQKMVEQHRASLSKEPFYHESLLIDRKEKKLSQAEKRQAQRGYELEKKASSKQVFNYQTNKLQYRIVRNDGTVVNRPVASVRPMQTMKTQSVFKNTGIRSTRWIPAEVWQRQGMTAQEMTLPLDVVIPTNSSDKSNIILKSGQRVMVLKSPKGIYMQLESGKIIAIRTSSKVNQTPKYEKEAVIDITSESNNSSSKTSSISKDNFENSTGCSSAAKGGIIKPSLKAERSNDDKNDVVIVNDDSNTKLKTPPKKVLQSNFSPKIGKSTLPIKKVDNYEEFGYGKESNLNSSNSNTKVVNSSTSQSGSTTFDQNSITNSKKFTTENTGQDVFPNFSNSSISEEKDISNTMSSFLQPHTNSKSVKSLEKSQTQIPNTADVKNDIASNNMLDNSLYTCSTSQVTDSLSSNYNTLSAPQQQQQSSQISSQVKQPLQQYSDQLPMTQQLHQHKDPYVSVYNLQHSHYGNKIPEVGANQQTTNSFIPSREPTQYSQYYDSMYDNNVATTYDYPHRYHSSHGSYSSSQPHYHPHFHSFGNAQSNPMSAHPYYMRWPTMPTVAQTGNQHNSLYPPPYSQNGTSSNQWHNHR